MGGSVGSAGDSGVEPIEGYLPGFAARGWVGLFVEREKTAMHPYSL
ncbi:hypothetical protein [Catellatospora sp. NPDC049133]